MDDDKKKEAKKIRSEENETMGRRHWENAARNEASQILSLRTSLARAFFLCTLCHTVCWGISPSHIDSYPAYTIHKWYTIAT